MFSIRSQSALDRTVITEYRMCTHLMLQSIYRDMYQHILYYSLFTATCFNTSYTIVYLPYTFTQFVAMLRSNYGKAGRQALKCSHFSFIGIELNTLQYWSTLFEGQLECHLMKLKFRSLSFVGRIVSLIQLFNCFSESSLHENCVRNVTLILRYTFLYSIDVCIIFLS